MSRFQFEQYERMRLKKIARACKPGSILDLGYAQKPNPYFADQNCTGVDLNENATNLHYREEYVADVTNLKKSELAGRRFDNVVAGELIEHIEEPYHFLRCLHKLLKDEGTLILSTPNPVSWPSLLFEWTMSRRFFYTREHAFYFAPRWVVRLLERCGYTVKSVKGVGFWLPAIVIPAPASLSYQVIYIAGKKTKDCETG